MKDPVRLKDFVADGKLELSLKDYLALVMANNTDIQIQMLTLETPKNAIQRAMRARGIPWPRASFNSQRSTTPSTSLLDGSAIGLTTLNQPFRARVPADAWTPVRSTRVGFNASKTSAATTGSPRSTRR